jgi:quinol monooxygenase YgiN
VTRTIISEMTLKPEVAADGYRPLFDILRATRESDGCLELELLVDRDDVCQVVLIVRWDCDESYNAYRDWRAGAGAADLGVLLAAPSRLRWLAAV